MIKKIGSLVLVLCLFTHSLQLQAQDNGSVFEDEFFSYEQQPVQASWSEHLKKWWQDRSRGEKALLTTVVAAVLLGGGYLVSSRFREGKGSNENDIQVISPNKVKDFAQSADKISQKIEYQLSSGKNYKDRGEKPHIWFDKKRKKPFFAFHTRAADWYLFRNPEDKENEMVFIGLPEGYTFLKNKGKLTVGMPGHKQYFVEYLEAQSKTNPSDIINVAISEPQGYQSEEIYTKKVLKKQGDQEIEELQKFLEEPENMKEDLLTYKVSFRLHKDQDGIFSFFAVWTPTTPRVPVSKDRTHTVTGWRVYPKLPEGYKLSSEKGKTVIIGREETEYKHGLYYIDYTVAYKSNNPDHKIMIAHKVPTEGDRVKLGDDKML